MELTHLPFRVALALLALCGTCAAEGAPSRRTDPIQSIPASSTQPELRDRVHAVWLNGPTYPTKLGGGSWPLFGAGSASTMPTCDATRTGFTGYLGDTGHSGYCQPSSAAFNDDPWHLVVHSGRLAVVLDAGVSTGLIPKLGVVSSSMAHSSHEVYNALSASSLDVTLDVTKTLSVPGPSEVNCASDHLGTNNPCPAEYPECRDFIAGGRWGRCWGTDTVTGSFGLTTGAEADARVNLVRQGHAVTHIIATNLKWAVPVEACEDVQEPFGLNCNQNFGGSSHPCISEYPECRGFVQGFSWGSCWAPCIPGGAWAELLLMEMWLELTVWPDTIGMQLVWDVSTLDNEQFSGSVTQTLTVNGNTISTTQSQISSGLASLLVTEESGSIQPVPSTFAPVTVTTSSGTVLPRSAQGDVMLEVPTSTPRCGYNDNCSPEVEIQFTASNDDVIERSLRLSVSRNFPLWDDSVSQSGTGAEITGMSAVLLGQDGLPTGIPIQVSKNWHVGSTDAHWAGYDGYWWTLNMFTRLPPRSAYTVSLRIFYQTYGRVPAFSHAQLSVVGYSDAWLWEEAALYSGGESICFDPLGSHTRTFVTDVRPSLMDGQWKENVGGHDFLVYFDAAGAFVYPKAVDPQIHSTGPCLSNATYSSVSADDAIRSRVQVSGGRTDDWVRVFIHVRHEVLADTGFSRLAFFQFGADNYAYHNVWEQMIIGQGPDGEVIYNQSRTCAAKDIYDGGPYREALSGAAPWWISLGPNTDDVVLSPSSTMVVGDKALIIRSYSSRLGGVDHPTPTISMLCDKIELNPPASVSTLSVGDFVDIRLELLTMPRSGAEYDYAIEQSSRHGSASTLQQFSGSEGWERARASAVGVQFHVDGSTLGFVPIVICGLSEHYPNASHGLWIRPGTTGNWSRLDQHSQYESDYWQTNYVRETKDYEIIFNLELFEQETSIAFGPEPSSTSCESIQTTFQATMCCTSAGFNQNAECGIIRDEYNNKGCCPNSGRRLMGSKFDHRRFREVRWVDPPIGKRS